jgi:NDP-sugar pyrophosphorylase family protein
MPRALLLAAGLGSRIRTVVGDLPKPLASVAGAPILAHNLRWLAGSGVSDVWINTHYRAEQIAEAVGDGSPFGLAAHLVYEAELLGTAGALGNIAEVVEDGMLVVYGDNLLRFDIAALRRTHAAAGAEVTLALFDQSRHRHTGIAGGRVLLDDAGRVSGFTEGAEGAEGGSSLVNAGVYVVSASILDLIPAGRLVDFGREVFPAMLSSGRRLQGHVIEATGFCLGLDTPESFAAGQALMESGQLVLA